MRGSKPDADFGLLGTLANRRRGKESHRVKTATSARQAVVKVEGWRGGGRRWLGPRFGEGSSLGAHSSQCREGESQTFPLTAAAPAPAPAWGCSAGLGLGGGGAATLSGARRRMVGTPLSGA